MIINLEILIENYMQILKIFLFSLAFISLFNSCNNCGKLDCISDIDSGQFRIVKATDGKDLVFGVNKIYDKNAIKFYTLKGTDTTFFQYEPLKFSGIGFDSILNVRFYPRTDIAYMRLSNSDIDTLQISYNTTKTKCCGTVTEITKFRLNNLVDIIGNNGTQEIKK